MQQYNKTIAAGLAGAIVTIILAVLKVYKPAIAEVLDPPRVQAALQTVITALAVYFSPANQPA